MSLCKIKNPYKKSFLSKTISNENFISERIETHQSTQNKVLFIQLSNQSTPSLDEDQQYSGRNVAIHIYVTQS